MEEVNEKKRALSEPEQPAKKVAKPRLSAEGARKREKRPNGYKAEQQVKKYAGKNLLFLKYAPVRRICRSVVKKSRPNTRLSDGFIHTVACLAQTEIMNILRDTMDHAKFNNTLDDNAYPKTVTTNNLVNVMCMGKEMDWPVRKKRETENMPHASSICDRIMPKQQ